jgi:hypothetical protein
MDEERIAPTGTEHPHADGATSASPPAATADLDGHEAVQETLPFGPDEPIPFALTVRARRTVAPASLPDLRVLDRADHAPGVPSASTAVRSRRRPDDGPVDLDDPHDTRPARARALRRAGIGLGQIAEELDVDVLVAQAWVGEVGPVHSARRRLRAVHEPDADHRDMRRSTVVAEEQQRARAFAERRDEARREGRRRLEDEPAFATGLGLVAGVLATSEHTALVTSRDPALAAAALRWIVAATSVSPNRVRVLLRLAPQVAGDEAAHAWAERLGLPAEQIAFTRWRAAPDAEAVEATIRIADADAAGRLAGWRDALLARLAPDGAGG